MTDGIDTRGQAFSLEAVISSFILLGALLFALQSVVVVPGSSGDLDASTRADLRQQASDILVTTARADANDLSTLVRNWSQSRQTFADAVNRYIGYGPERPPGAFGEMLNQTFTQRGHLYDVNVVYRQRNLSNGTGRVPMVDRGKPSDQAVTASYTLTLYDNQTLTARNASRNVELWQYDTNATNNVDGYYPIPNAVDGPVYNVVEVRIVVW
ncbi:MAG: hypothetical protein ABEJ40_02805 [Haloarculaceae archaeon]